METVSNIASSITNWFWASKPSNDKQVEKPQFPGAEESSDAPGTTLTERKIDHVDATEGKALLKQYTTIERIFGWAALGAVGLGIGAALFASYMPILLGAAELVGKEAVLIPLANFCFDHPDAILLLNELVSDVAGSDHKTFLTSLAGKLTGIIDMCNFAFDLGAKVGTATEFTYNNLPWAFQNPTAALSSMYSYASGAANSAYNYFFGQAKPYKNIGEKIGNYVGGALGLTGMTFNTFVNYMPYIGTATVLTSTFANKIYRVLGNLAFDHPDATIASGFIFPSLNAMPTSFSTAALAVKGAEFTAVTVKNVERWSWLGGKVGGNLQVALETAFQKCSEAYNVMTATAEPTTAAAA